MSVGISVRTALAFVALLASLCGCAAVGSVASGVTSSIGDVASRIAHPFLSEPGSAPVSSPGPAGLDDYKAEVARHVARRNPDRVYSGTLPAMLPAIVVLEITVDRDGRLTGIDVQRARDAHAAEVALESMRRSAPLPAPQRLTRQLAYGGGALKFSETFLFADAERYQLRSLAGPQATQ